MSIYYGWNLKYNTWGRPAKLKDCDERFNKMTAVKQDVNSKKPKSQALKYQEGKI